MSTRILIVDDELQSRSLIQKLLSDHFPTVVTEEAESVTVALGKIKEFDPELAFLDVQMRGETGFDLLDQVGRVNFGIIFTTAHSEYAVRAFRYSAFDYLMKPLDRDDFRVSVEKALKRLTADRSVSHEQLNYLKQLKSDQKIPDKLTIPTAEGFHFVKIDDIIYCHAMSNYTEFHLTNKRKLISSYTLGYYNDLLEQQNFFRLHRSYLVNLVHIKMYKRGDGGVVVMDDGEEIEVSRSNKETFMKLFKG